MEDNVPLGEIFFIFLSVALAVAGLVMISFAGGWYWIGIVVFLISVFAGLYSIKRYYDRWEMLRRPH